MRVTNVRSLPLVVWFVAIGALAAACGGDSATTTAVTADVAQTAAPLVTSAAPSSSSVDRTSLPRVAIPAGCTEGQMAGPGHYDAFNPTSDGEQKYWVTVPDNYADVAPAPLYLVLAPGTGDPDINHRMWKAQDRAKSGVLEVMVGTRMPAHEHAATLQNLLDRLTTDYCVDHARIHVLGASRTASAASVLGCEASDRVASFLTSIGPTDPGSCVPTRPVPMLSFTGDPERQEVRAGVERWAELNGCKGAPTVEELGSGVSRITYGGCEAAVVLYDINGMGHVFPRHDCTGQPGCAEYAEFDWLAECDRFFAQHPMP